ncbi:MAG: TlpA disulfide reductase family protein [Desulfatiglans sp.]|nr:TlpA disulfide reductase family protein [Thermodesulfobacteriota bacterium]MEE4352057.1 TlpA disulfide reductase family protein [Desulfatiglans sp.]
MNDFRRMTIFVTGVFFFALIIFGCQKETDADTIGPDFSLLDLSGQERTLGEFKGKVVLLDFWATWCLPCKMSLPKLVKLQKENRDKGLIILGVSLDNPESMSNKDLLVFKEKNNINYPILRANQKILQDYFKDSSIAIPTLFIIDREGRIRDKIVGYEPGAVEKGLLDVLK